MPNVMDYMISPYPIRIIDSKVDASKLKLRTIRVGQVGHLPGRTLFRKGVVFEHWAVVYIVSGSGVYAENGREEQIVSGENLFFFRPGCSYDFGPLQGGSWDEYYINFNGTRIMDWLEAGLIAGGDVFQVRSDKGFTHFFEGILTRMEGGAPADADRAALLLEELLLECSFVIKENGRTAQEDLMPQIREDLHSCIYGHMDVVQIAAKHHISMSTLRRLVRRSSGYPLHDYIHRLKMSEAKHLLLNTSLRVKEIAGRLHYQDTFYFSRLFKKYMGISPQKCRCNV
ncbi:helix-turn-helix domain-containing protein [Paenibacillus wynnii]|uniref:helix-turn-helix domain-containing protein n=1 Tax=Paenibacillus wynnii TaxID=268407 RepID=UPI00279514BA|nr:AraC family transcriptional regulator [Paenibacillus wynnii]MDQ0193946.1 AraC-like DNA-binding protein [Paenibacillus wynnii]